VLRPRFLLGVTRRRLRVRLGALMGRDIAVDLGDGFRLRLPARDSLVRKLLEDDFERPERDFITRTLRPGDVFVDVGANIGVHAIVAARAVMPGGRVYALEPNPATFRALERNVAANGFNGTVRCICVAASDAAGVASLHVPGAGYAAHSSLADPHMPLAGEIEVEVAQLDDLVQDSPALVKIDVEGWERHVIAGAHRLLSARDAPHLLVEFADLASAYAGTTTDELAADFERLGYRLFRYDHRARELAMEQRPGRYGGNLVASKRIDELRARIGKQEAVSASGKRGICQDLRDPKFGAHNAGR
jgi:FkbM family methyltransferase